MSKKKKLFLVDGSSYIFRAFHATERSRMTTSKGLPTNAAYVFTTMLQRLIKEQEPDYLVVVWDAPGKTFRDEKYPDYKANRKETPSDLLPQFEYIRELVNAFRVATLEKEGYEADDVIATIAEKLRPRDDLEIVIVSGDKDLGQVLAENVKLYDSMKERLTTAENVRGKYGFSPEELIDFFALTGDSVDNIRGVKGIGEKTAAELVREFHSLENLYQHLDRVRENLREKLQAHRADAFLSRELVELCREVPLKFQLEDFRVKEPDREKLVRLFRELEFNKLLSEYSAASAEVKRGDYKLVLDQAALDELASELANAGEFAFDLESTSLNPLQAEPVGFSFATSAGRAFYLPFGHKLMLGEQQLLRQQVFAKLKPILESEQAHKIGQNLKYDYMVLQSAGIELKGIKFDTMLASYLLNPRRKTHNLHDLALEHFGHKMLTFEDVTGKGKNQKLFSEVDLQSACQYSAEDADLAFRLYKKLAPLLEKSGLEKIYYEMELPLAFVLGRMELAGVKVDASKLRALSSELAEKEAALQKEIFELAKGEFNLDSPRQLAEVLFSRLNLPPSKKTKTGYSTSFEVLQELAAKHPLPAKIIAYRTLSKLRNTYTDALIQLIEPRTGRLHTSYNQAVTATGRLSSSNPNLQNIPTRTPEGKKIREAFIAEQGFKLLAADYSQIELRVLAHFSEEPALLEAFARGEDIHARTAIEVFGVKPDEVTPELRRRAKVINFGILYGMSDFGLAQELGIDQKEAKKYIDAYFQRYPRVSEFLDRILAEARKSLRISTLMGRHCHFPDINSQNQMVRKAAEREAVNAPMQGSAADIIKAAMLKIDRRMAENKMKSRMIMQVHDELIFEAADDEVEELKKIAVQEMESAAKLKVPLKVDTGLGQNWAEAG